MTNWSDVLRAIDRELAAWFPAQCADNFSRYYLYFKAAVPGQHGELRIAQELPGAGYKLANAAFLSRGKTIAQNRAALLPVLGKLPILTV